MMMTDTRTILMMLMTIHPPVDGVATETKNRHHLADEMTIPHRVDRVAKVLTETKIRRRHTGENTATPTPVTLIDGKNRLQLAQYGTRFVHL